MIILDAKASRSTLEVLRTLQREGVVSAAYAFPVQGPGREHETGPIGIAVFVHDMDRWDNYKRTGKMDGIPGASKTDIELHVFPSSALQHPEECKFIQKILQEGVRILGDNEDDNIGGLSIDISQLRNICKKWRINELSLFGSVLRDDFSPESDIDVLVSFEANSPWSLWDLMVLKEELGNLFNGRSVDLVEKEAIRNPWRKREILRTREIIYAPGRQ